MKINYYIGLDVHARTSSLCILNSTGEIVKERTIRGNWSKLFEAFDQIKGEFCVCYEASNGYGYIYDQN